MGVYGSFEGISAHLQVGFGLQKSEMRKAG